MINEQFQEKRYWEELERTLANVVSKVDEVVSDKDISI